MRGARSLTVVTRWLRIRLVVDRFVAALLLVPAAPVIAVLAAVIRRSDGQRGLVALERIGRHGVPFRMWKLRTMRVERDDGSAGGAALTSGDDDRITPIGRKLRRARIDELPQLWNVVRGEMALIGPRPEAPDYVDDNDAWRAVLETSPAIIGPTQLLVHQWEAQTLRTANGDDVYRRTILPVKLDIDRWYVENASPRVDGVIILELLRGFAFGRAPRALLRVISGSDTKPVEMRP